MTPWSEESNYRLTDNVEQMQIQYRNSSEDQWVSEWLMAPDRTLPSHVKISLKVDGRYWPEIIIPVRGW
ncbi:hypothetical protein [Gilvimarinus algae]|uniref:General secretion pathway protein GspJ n=1 Tax=Gilvimarinus algae TaxID=3058037 RepID=A0ABT8TLS0_9GAMM|nr:hypothetical protein [Gilvimarinus sp. SDUM040014]MDO3383576.1 hypothetical protein [Gilvimarinus sp. SDUM040014]